MSALVGADWSSLSDGEVDRGRRLLIVSASAAAALLLANSPPLRQTLAALTPAADPAGIVRSFGKARWDWTVELAVLHHVETDRAYALDLLWAALELDLDPKAKWRRKRARRLYDLYAAAAGAPGRAALARLVISQSADPALLARAALWADTSRSRPPRLWRAAGPNGRMLGIHLDAA